MTKLEALEQAVRELAAQELDEFRAWFDEFDAARFDSKIERDAREGKLDKLAEAAAKDHRDGRTRRI
jgi:hypothetical protein